MCTEILSVGIDIGTSTTQVIFSRLYVEDTSSYFSVPTVSIIDKKVIYKSEIYFTPFRSRTEINGEGVKEIVEREFRKAGFTPEDTQTGAVIITGESARKENANIVAESLSSLAGDFVVSTAGPDLESIIAGKGSGAQQYSIDHNCTVANLDIGGGTTNMALFDCGEVIAKGCLDIGGRLIRVDKKMRVEYLSEKASLIANSLKIDLAEGKKTTEDSLHRITNKMSNILEQALGFTPPENEEILQALKTKGSTSFAAGRPINCLCFSGGVADYIYKSYDYSNIRDQDLFPYGDIGVLLGKSIRESTLFSRKKIIHPGETIRATVVGAGTYTTSLSGSTIFYTREIFPLKNIPVLYLNRSEEQECLQGNKELLSERVRWFLEQSGSGQLALGFRGKKNPSFEEIKRFARCIAVSVDRTLSGDAPVIVVVEADMAKVLGQALFGYLGNQRGVVCIDSIRVAQGDYVDIGKPLVNGMVLPVVVKTLIFG